MATNERYHIGRNGQPARCTARVKACPLAGMSDPNNPIVGLHGPKNYIDGVAGDWQRQSRVQGLGVSLSRNPGTAVGVSPMRSPESGKFSPADLQALRLDEVPDTMLPDGNDEEGTFRDCLNNGEISEFLAGVDAVLDDGDVVYNDGARPYGVRVADATMYRKREYDENGELRGDYVIIDRNGLVTKTETSKIREAREMLMTELASNAAVEAEYLNAQSNLKAKSAENVTSADRSRAAKAKRDYRNRTYYDAERKGMDYPAFRQLAQLTRAYSKNQVKENLDASQSTDKSDITCLMPDGSEMGVSLKSFSSSGSAPSITKASNATEGAIRFEAPTDDEVKTSVVASLKEKLAKDKRGMKDRAKKFMAANPKTEKYFREENERRQARKEPLMSASSFLMDEKYRGKMIAGDMLERGGKHPFGYIDRGNDHVRATRSMLKLAESDPAAYRKMASGAIMRASLPVGRQSVSELTGDEYGEFLRNVNKFGNEYGFHRNDEAFDLVQRHALGMGDDSQFDRSDTAYENYMKVNGANDDASRARTTAAIGKAYFDIATKQFDLRKSPEMQAITRHLATDMTATSAYDPATRPRQMSFGVTMPTKRRNALGGMDYDVKTRVSSYADTTSTDGHVVEASQHWMDDNIGRVRLSSYATESSGSARNKSRIFANRDLSSDPAFNDGTGSIILTANVDYGFRKTEA